MRNSKKFKFLGKFFFREKTWTVSISLPAVSQLVASPWGHTRNQQGFPRQPAGDLPLAENARQRTVGRF